MEPILINILALTLGLSLGATIASLYWTEVNQKIWKKTDKIIELKDKQIAIWEKRVENKDKTIELKDKQLQVMNNRLTLQSPIKQAEA